MTYLPFPDLQINWNSDKSGFKLSLPWVLLEIETHPTDLAWIEEATTLLQSDTQNKAVQRFLSELSDYEVAYTAPRVLTGEPVPPEEDRASWNIALLQTPQAFAQEIDKEASFDLNIQLAPHWQWDLEEVFRVSQISGSEYYDPITVISYLKGLMLRSDAASEQFRAQIPLLLDQLRQADESAFFEFMKTMLRQTHHITQWFQEYAPLSLTTFPEAKKEIEQFLSEEKGHDKLMEHSLKVLSVEHPETLPVLPENVLLMNLFKYAIQSCPLAFTAMVGFFEGGDYGETDPLADILKKSSLPQAALGYERHFEINKEGNHNQVIKDLAKKLPLQSRSKVAFTTRLLELAAYIGSASDKYLVSAIKSVA